MGWASEYIERLKAGEVVSFRPRGNSMSPRIESGELCTVAPVNTREICVGDIVLCKVHGAEYLHLVKAVDHERFQIGNNRGHRGHVNGWVGSKAIFGKLISVKP